MKYFNLINNRKIWNIVVGMHTIAYAYSLNLSGLSKQKKNPIVCKSTLNLKVFGSQTDSGIL